MARHNVTLLELTVICAVIYVCCAQTTYEQCFYGNSVGTCIPIHSCGPLFQVLTKKPLTQEDKNYLQSVQCGFEGKVPKVCCVQSVEPSTSRPVQEFTPPPNQGGVISNPATHNLLPDESICGQSNEDRIVGGEVTELDEYPWLALLEYRKPRGSGFYCGGVLINERYVLTAAHCVKGKDLPKTWTLSSVRLGEYNTSSRQDCVDHGFNNVECSDDPIDVPVDERIAHESYNPYDNNQYHDIALLRLARSVSFTSYIKPICLPPQDDLEGDTLDVGKSMWVAGWGKTENKSESDVKLKVKVPVKSISECTPRYKQAGVKLATGQICAGGEKGKDSCRGDSGGALMTVETNRRGNNNWYAAGVVSFGPSPCGTPGWPGIYTRVAKYTNWIISKLKS